MAVQAATYLILKNRGKIPLWRGDPSNQPRPRMGDLWIFLWLGIVLALAVILYQNFGPGPTPGCPSLYATKNASVGFWSVVDVKRIPNEKCGFVLTPPHGTTERMTCPGGFVCQVDNSDGVKLMRGGNGTSTELVQAQLRFSANYSGKLDNICEEQKRIQDEFTKNYPRLAFKVQTTPGPSDPPQCT